jgi:hypothetical protein
LTPTERERKENQTERVYLSSKSGQTDGHKNEHTLDIGKQASIIHHITLITLITHTVGSIIFYNKENEIQTLH